MIIQKLDQKAHSEVPLVSSLMPPTEYFGMGKKFLMGAGKCKKEQDFQGAYLNLKKYMILVLEKLPYHDEIHDPSYSGEYQFNVGKAKKMGGELEKLKKTLSQKDSKSSKKSSGGFLSLFGGGSKKKKKLPPPPKVKKFDGDDPLFGNSTTDKLVTTLAQNENVQDSVGRGVANLAENEYVQEQFATGVKNMAESEEYQEFFGDAFAENTDNEILKQMAKSKKLQKAVGTGIAKTVGNKELQKKAGKAIAKAARDKEVQKKVATGVTSMAKGAKLGWSAYKASQDTNDE